MAAPLIAAAAMAAKHLAKKAAKARRKSGVKKDNKENAEDSTTKELSGELRFREPRRQPFDYADDDYGFTPRMSDDYKKGGKVSKGMHRMPDGKMMKDSEHKKPKKPTKPKKMMGGGMMKYGHGGSVDGCAIRGKTKGRMI
jgi:hypothetical protein